MHIDRMFYDAPLLRRKFLIVHNLESLHSRYTNFNITSAVVLIAVAFVYFKNRLVLDKQILNLSKFYDFSYFS